MNRFLVALCVSTGLALSSAAPAYAQQGSVQGTSLLGEQMVTYPDRNANVADPKVLERAARDARAAYEADKTIDNATWYGRVLFYQGYARESLAVYNEALARYPNSAKLLRHRAHRYFSLRQFDKSIADGLRAAKLYENKPLEREKLGPDYFPSTPDIVQFYLYYHLGQAYFAKKDFANAAHWFAKSADASAFGSQPEDQTATTYWRYLSLARGGNVREAQALLDSYDVTLFELHPDGGTDPYFDGIQLFKGHRPTNSLYSREDSGRPFANADGMASSTSYSLANYYLLKGERDQAKQWLRRAMEIDSWSFFAKIQAEADWVALFPNEKP